MSQIQGYAAIFNSTTDITDGGGSFRESVDPHAFDRVLRSSPDVLILYNHSPNQLLGRTKSGTARVYADSRGLVYTCDLPDTQLGKDVYTLVQRRDLSGSSFGFAVTRDDWSVSGGVLTRRILEIGALIDCSPVTMPAYPDTSVTT